MFITLFYGMVLNIIQRLGFVLKWIPKLFKSARSEDSFKSTVSDLIAYEFLNPQWEQMIKDIINFQKKWNFLKTKLAPDRIEDIKRRFQVKYCDINTDPLEESDTERKQQETQNLWELCQFFDKVVKEAELDCFGLIEKSVLQEAHKIAVHGKNIKKGCTRPGEFSSNARFTTHYSFVGEYYYRQPDDMVEEVDLVLDRFNSLIIEASGKSDEREKLNGILKSLSWFLFEILDLHPFGNGNGRVFRTFCHYVLFSCGQTVVPCPIYNVCTNTEKGDHSTCKKPCKDTYECSLISARKSTTRHPEELAMMLLESCWRTWNEFMDQITRAHMEQTSR